jgi:hypothetical protein
MEGISLETRQKHKWLPEEEAYIRKSYGKKKTSVMSRELDRPYRIVSAKVHRLFPQPKSGEWKIITPWMSSMLERIENIGKSIYDLSLELHEQKIPVEIVEDGNGMMALKSTRTLN